MFEKCMRVCPFCKAEISDFDSQCEYCGKEIPLDPECETILQDAEFVLQKAENAVNENSGGSKKIKDVMESVARKIDFLKQFEDVERIKKLLNSLAKNQELLEQKFISIRKKEKRRAIIFSIFAEISIFLFLFLASNFEAESVETFIYGFFWLHIRGDRHCAVKKFLDRVGSRSVDGCIVILVCDIFHRENSARFNLDDFNNNF